MAKRHKASNWFYQLSHFFGKVGSNLNDFETLATGNPKKICQRFLKKKIYKETNKIARKINRHIK